MFISSTSDESNTLRRSFCPDDEIKQEAARQDRSLSWIVQKARKTARHELTKYPDMNGIPEYADDDRGELE